MPKIFEVRGYKFYLYTDDHLPVHVHVRRGGSEAKIVVEPDIAVSVNHGFKSHELRQIIVAASGHSELIVEKWHEIHDQQRD